MPYAIDDAGLIEFATRLAQTPSVSTGEQAAVELAAGAMRALGFPRVEIDATGNAIGIFGSGDHPRLLIDGHIDTIPLHSSDRWSVDPFAGTIRDGRLYGLGICDQKGFPSVSTVPGEAVARFDCRFLPGETAESLLATLQGCVEGAWADWAESPQLGLEVVQASFDTWTGQHVTAPEFEKAWWTDEASPLVTTSRGALEGVGIDATPTHYSFCTNGSYLAGERGIPTIGFGVGLEHMAHQVDEFITLDSLRTGAQGFAALATALTRSR